MRCRTSATPVLLAWVVRSGPSLRPAIGDAASRGGAGNDA
jgi:hypothetical protein